MNPDLLVTLVYTDQWYIGSLLGDTAKQVGADHRSSWAVRS